MKTLNEIKEIIQKHKPEIQEKYKVKEIGVFGSFVRHEEKEDSDIDILVSFREPIGLFEFMDLEDYLKKLTQLNIDLVSRKALKPKIEQRILKEVIYV